MIEGCLPRDVLERLERDGYACIPAALGPDEVRELQRAVRGVVTRASPFFRTPFDFEHGGRAACGLAINGDVLYRIKYSLDKHRRLLALLGNPVLLKLAATLIAKPFLVCWEDLMVKEAGEPFGVPWHQDCESASEATYTIGCYIVGSGDHPLRVIPGSHRAGIMTPAEVDTAIRERERDAVVVLAQAGDLVVHNLNLLHESGPCGSESRYTTFFEFQSIERALANPEWGADFVEARRHFVAAAVRARRSFADLLAEDTARGMPDAPHPELWRHATVLPDEAEIEFRIPQAKARWCRSPTDAQRVAAVARFLAITDIVQAAEEFGVSEEALFKWICEAGAFRADRDGRYLDHRNVLKGGLP